MLIRAHWAGLRIVEEPIRFVFRTEGQSKLRVLPTTLSYLSLLRTRSCGTPVPGGVLWLITSTAIVRDFGGSNGTVAAS